MDCQIACPFCRKRDNGRAMGQETTKKTTKKPNEDHKQAPAEVFFWLIVWIAQ